MDTRLKNNQSMQGRNLYSLLILIGKTKPIIDRAKTWLIFYHDRLFGLVKQFIKQLKSNECNGVEINECTHRIYRVVHLFDTQKSVHLLAQFLNWNWPDLIH